MSRVYAMDREHPAVIELLKAGRVPGLSHIHMPYESAWQDGVTDGANYGWFEANLIEFFGDNDEDAILHKLAKHGVTIYGQLY